MIVGAAVVEIRVHGSRSLKEKRGVIQAIKQRVRNRFNLAVSEVGGQDTWQLAQLGLTTAGNEARVVKALLERAIRFIEDLNLAEVQDSDIEVLTLSHSEPRLEYDGGGEE